MKRIFEQFKPTDYLDAGVALALFFAAVVLLGWFMHAGMLTNDEAQCLNLALSAHDPMSLVKAVNDDQGNPPFIYVVIDSWSMIFASNSVTMQWLFVLIDALVPPVLYLALREFSGRTVALTSAVCLMLCPPFLAWGPMVRSYGIAALMVVLLVPALLRLMAEPDKWKHRLTYAFLFVVLICSHGFGCVTAFAHAVTFMVGLLVRWWNKEQIRAFLISVCIAIVVSLPSSLGTLSAMSYSASNRYHVSFVSAFFAVPVFLFNNEDVIAVRDWYAITVAYTAFFIMLLFPVLSAIRRERTLTLIGLLGAASYIGACLTSTIMWRDRYIVEITPLTILCFISGLGLLFKPNKLKIAVCIAAIVAFIPGWKPQWIKIKKMPPSSVGLATEGVKARMNSSRDLFLVAYQIYAPEVALHNPPGNTITWPDGKITPGYYVVYLRIDERLQDPAILQKIEADMSRSLQAGGKVWVMEPKYWQALRFPLAKQGIVNIEEWLKNNAAPGGENITYDCVEGAVQVRSFVKPPDSSGISQSPTDGTGTSKQPAYNK